MVVQKTIDNLKERPKEDRAAVAASVATAVVVILMIGWVIFFFRKVSRGTPPAVNAPVGANEVFDFTSLDQATRDFADSYSDTKSQLERLRDQAAEAQVQQSATYDPNGVEIKETSVFGEGNKAE